MKLKITKAKKCKFCGKPTKPSIRVFLKDYCNDAHRNAWGQKLHRKRQKAKG